MDNPEDVAVNSKIPSPWFGCFLNGIAERSYFVFVEGQVATHVTTFSKAFAVWFVTHYIYNLEYCKDIKEIAHFIQEFIFLLPSREKKSSTYLYISTGIKNFADS